MLQRKENTKWLNTHNCNPVDIILTRSGVNLMECQGQHESSGTPGVREDEKKIGVKKMGLSGAKLPVY